MTGSGSLESNEPDYPYPASASVDLYQAHTHPFATRECTGSKWQHVAAMDTIAETNQALSYKLLNIDRLLKVKADAADGLFQCKPGDMLASGDLPADRWVSEKGYPGETALYGHPCRGWKSLVGGLSKSPSIEGCFCGQCCRIDP